MKNGVYMLRTMRQFMGRKGEGGRKEGPRNPVTQAAVFFAGPKHLIIAGSPIFTAIGK
jgi:hypothetical protein